MIRAVFDIPALAYSALRESLDSLRSRICFCRRSSASFFWSLASNLGIRLTEQGSAMKPRQVPSNAASCTPHLPFQRAHNKATYMKRMREGLIAITKHGRT